MKSRIRHIAIIVPDPEAAAKFFENIIDADQHLVKKLDVFFVVRAVFHIFGKGSFARRFVRNGPNFYLDAERAQVFKNLAVKLRHRQPVAQLKLAAVTRITPDFQFVLAKIEFDLRIAAAERDRARRDPARRNIKRHMPPVINARKKFQADLADDL